MLRALTALWVLCACGSPLPHERADAGVDGGTNVDVSPELDAALDAPDGTPTDDTGAPLTCEARSSTFGAPASTLDVGPTSSARLRFDVPDLPEPALVRAARLHFTVLDADHPGEEGVVEVNGRAYDLPAMAAWDNVTSPVSIDVTDATLRGDNVVLFGPGPLARSYFAVSDVWLELEAWVASCPGAAPTPTRRELHFHEATFTNRATWVVPCPPGHPRWQAIRDYAFTASGAEHEPTDCDGLYRAGSGERGTATFTFDGVVPATYGIHVRYRSSANRNPAGALFVVNGEEQRIDQIDASGDYFEVLWGERALAGTVTVVLDSSREAESDSVTWVRLEPL